MAYLKQNGILQLKTTNVKWCPFFIVYNCWPIEKKSSNLIISCISYSPKTAWKQMIKMNMNLTFLPPGKPRRKGS